MKLFIAHLMPHLPTLHANVQHGFCPGHSCLSAVATLLPCANATKAHNLFTSSPLTWKKPTTAYITLAWTL